MSSIDWISVTEQIRTSNQDPHSAANLLKALASLNEISAAINHMPPERADVNDALQRIVESAILVVPNSSAVIFTYNSSARRFEAEQSVWAGESTPPAPGHDPRPGGLGARAVAERRAVFSYEENDLVIHPLKVQAGARSAACFPLIVAQDVVGALYVYLHEARRFSDLERLMLENFVNQAALAISHTHHLATVQQELVRREEELRHLRRTGLLISSRLQVKDTLEAILQMALEITNARYGIFRLVDKTGQNLVMHAIAGDGLAHPLIENLPLDSPSVMAQAARTRQTLLIPDLRQPPWSEIYYPLDAQVEMRSELAVPLIDANGRLEGVLNLESTRVAAFSEQDSHLLQAMATQAVIAIQETRLLDAQLEVAGLLLTQPAQQVLARLVALACDLLNASSSAVWRLDHAARELSLEAASRGLANHGSAPDWRIGLPAGLDSAALGDGRAILAIQQAETEELSGLALTPDWQSMLIMPLISSGSQQTLGLITVIDVRAVDSDWNAKILGCLAHYAALALQNASHQEALRAAQERTAVAETFAAVGDIAANVLHHLNNKVGTIPVRIQGIQAKSKVALAGDAYLAAGLTEIEQNARQALDTVRDSLSHLNPIHLTPIHVATCVDAAILEAGLPPAITLTRHGLDQLPLVLASQRGLSLVFVNLLHNAREALSGEGGRIAFTGSSLPGWVEVAVRDSGPGIPAELHEQIFELHFSGRSGQRPNRLGFGLWWVKTLMARLGGSVRVESDGQQGTAFIIRLPEVQG